MSKEMNKVPLLLQNLGYNTSKVVGVNCALCKNLLESVLIKKYEKSINLSLRDPIFTEK